MRKHKYTWEQLEFYFKQLMERLKRIPREEDLERQAGYPSVKAYTERFGSWSNAVKLFGNIELAKKRCLNCGKTVIKRSKSQKFCSKECSVKYYSKKHGQYTKTTEKKLVDLLGGKCFICDFEKIVEIHSLDNKKESKTKILKAHGKKDVTGYILLCPNHHQMVHAKMARTNHKDGEIVWEELVIEK